jgi:hypothetical protein
MARTAVFAGFMELCRYRNTGSQLVKKIYGHKFHCHIHKSLTVDSVLSQLQQVDKFMPHFLKSTHKSSKQILHFKTSV